MSLVRSYHHRSATSIGFRLSSSSSTSSVHVQQEHQHHVNLFEYRSFTECCKSYDVNTWISLIKSCTCRIHLLQIYAHFVRTNFFQDPVMSAALLSQTALSSSRDTDYSRLILSQIRKPSVSHYNALIKGYSQSKCPENALYFYRHMKKLGVHPDPISSSFVLKSCTKISSSMGGKQIHSRIFRDGHGSDCRLLTSLMDFYANCDCGEEAQKVFDEMRERDTVAWNVLISSYCRNRRTRDALQLFDKMQSSRFYSKPDNVTCLLLLQASGDVCSLEFGERIHNYIIEQGYGEELTIRNSLVTMYSKCGSMEKAFQIFKTTENKNVVTWSAFISGLAMNGYGREAIEAFLEMQNMGIKPEEQTFTGVLSACSHSGLVDEGMYLFEKLKTQFGLKPNIHHYGCMIDLLGRAGLLDQAYWMINSMELKPDSTIWRTLLGACRIHGHVGLGEQVVNHIIELKAEQAGDFILLLNIYSSVGNWEKVAELRKIMKNEGIQTSPGCSTIVLNGQVHEFIVDDDFHPEKKEIYRMLNEIISQLKIAGYVPEMAAELHNLEAGQKENVLSYHSEKLAISFGILKTPPGKTIRIAKNLRICVDCHSFTKILSGVYDRFIVIRDRVRFHHFKNGICSCQDYW